jgi:hypothetical protein
MRREAKDSGEDLLAAGALPGGPQRLFHDT